MQQIDDILALTDRVQQFVDDGCWAEANALETERLALLAELFAREDVAAFSPACEALARDLLARNAGMLQALDGQRQRLNDATRQLKSAPQAIHAYQANKADDRWDRKSKSAATTIE